MQRGVRGSCYPDIEISVPLVFLQMYFTVIRIFMKPDIKQENQVIKKDRRNYGKLRKVWDRTSFEK